jgi:hypothetical protein
MGIVITILAQLGFTYLPHHEYTFSQQTHGLGRLDESPSHHLSHLFYYWIGKMVMEKKRLL